MLQDNLIIVRPWPAKSPDLNPIKHLWDVLKRRIRRHPPPNNVADLERLATEGWENITQRAIKRFIVSMRARCQTVIAAAGGHMRYWYYVTFENGGVSSHYSRDILFIFIKFVLHCW